MKIDEYTSLFSVFFIFLTKIYNTIRSRNFDGTWRVRIRKSLTGLVVVLVAPSLLFASLWFHDKFAEIRMLDRSQAGLRLMRSLAPLMQEKALTGQVREVPRQTQEQVAALSRTRDTASLQTQFDTFLTEETASKALINAQAVVVLASKLTGLQDALSEEASILPHLINDTLLSVAIESAFMVQQSAYLQGRDRLSAMEKIQLPVRGGQFKFAADRVAHKAFEQFPAISADTAESLHSAAKAFRDSSTSFQVEATKLISSLLAENSGRKLQTGSFRNAQSRLAVATFNLSNAVMTHMRDDLEKRRTETLLAVCIAAILIGLVIAATVAIGMFLAHALEDRTKSAFENLSFHDALTGLPNRRALAKAIRSLPNLKSNVRTGLILLDLRHFKKINDRFGNFVGDTILKDVADRLGEHAEPEDFLSRTGGTEFMLLRPDVSDRFAFKELPERVIAALGKDRLVHGQNATLKTNAGLFIGPPGERISEQVLVDVALALRASKERGPDRSVMFTPGMRADFQEQGRIVKDLRRALKAEHIQPWFQPQVDIQNGQITGAEALVRWVDDDRIRYPGSFLPAATEAGYMEQIETTVQQKTLEAAACLDATPLRRVQFSLNMSPSVLSNKAAVDSLVRSVSRLKLPPSSISVEILEAVMIDDGSSLPIKENIARLAEHGFYIELDDFGTGHSSISSLRDLKVDRVKIDRSFVSNVDSNPGLQKFTSALINLAKSLDIRVLAEGVETEAEWDWLKQNGCDYIQGFLISEAVPADEFYKLVQAEHRKAKDFCVGSGHLMA